MKKQYKYQIYALGFQYISTPIELLLVKSCDNHFLLTHCHPHGVEFALLLSMFVLFLPFQFVFGPCSMKIAHERKIYST